jgi:alpha-L-rhamnosidase
MEVLAQENEFDVAYTLLFQHKNPSWLYSVDQGATTVWERWNSYTKKDGFGPVGMNSFNHYAYGAVLAWIYRHAAGIACDSDAPGFRTVVMAPKPDRRLGYVKAEYRTAFGLVKSAWRYDGEMWIWEFTVPEGATADVTIPGESVAKRYAAGTYRIVR